MQRGDTLYVIEKLLVFAVTCIALGDLDLAMIVFFGIIETIGAARVYDAAMKAASRCYFIRPDLLFPRDAPYYKILETGNDRAYISLVRMPKACFDYLFSNLDPDWVAHHDGFTDRTRQHRRTGRPHMLDARAILALTLAWFGSTGKMQLLELIFGVGHSVLDRDLTRGKAELLSTLRRLAETMPTMPSFAQMDLFAETINGTHGPNPYPSSRLWGFIDGLRLQMLNPDDTEQQSFFYNNWIKLTNVVCVFVFTPDGRISIASINNPGSMHDFTVSRHIINTLNDLRQNPLHYGVIGDSAFSSDASDSTIATAENFRPPPRDIPADPSGAARRREQFFHWHRRVRQCVLEMHARPFSCDSPPLLPPPLTYNPGALNTVCARCARFGPASTSRCPLTWWPGETSLKQWFASTILTRPT